MLTFGEVLPHIDHAVHDSMDARISPRRIINDAGRFLYSMRAWEFANRMTSTGSLVSGQNTIDLPLGVASIIEIAHAASWPWRIERTTQAGIAQLRAAYSATILNDPPQVYYWAPSFERDTLGTSIGVQLTATVWPTPTASAVDSLLVTFAAKWEEVPAELDEINDWTLPIPDFAEQLYLAIVRETAKGYEFDGAGTVEARLAAVRAWPSFDATVQQDNRIAPVNGPMCNGAIDTARRGRIYGRRDDPIFFDSYDLTNPP